MKIYSPALRYFNGDWCMGIVPFHWFICNQWLSRHFDIPEHAQRIWLVAMNRPTSNSIKLSITQVVGARVCVNGSVQDAYLRLLNFLVRHKLNHKTIYLSVEYE